MRVSPLGQHAIVAASSNAVLDRDSLQRAEAIERLKPLLTAVARALDAAERQLDAAAGTIVVHEHLTGLDLARDPHRTTEI